MALEEQKRQVKFEEIVKRREEIRRIQKMEEEKRKILEEEIMKKNVDE